MKHLTDIDEVVKNHLDLFLPIDDILNGETLRKIRLAVEDQP